MPTARVISRGRFALLRFDMTQSNFKIVRDLPEQNGYVGRDLQFVITQASTAFLEAKFPDAIWDETSKNMREVAAKRKQVAEDAVRTVRDFAFKTKPFEHQQEVFSLSRDLKVYALLMEQGTGKTKVVIDTTAWLYAKGEIVGLLVIAPNGVHRNWVTDELPVHCPAWTNYERAVWSARKGEKELTQLLSSKREGLKVFCINVEALSTPRGAKAAERFMLAFPCLCAIDEATTIKSPKAKRTKTVQKLGRFAPYRRIMTGTIVTKSPLDVYEPMRFLDEDILGFSSFVTFRARYAVMKELPGKLDGRGRAISIPVAYQHMEELRDKIRTVSYRKLKSECLDLPEKLYQRRPFQMSDEQWDYYQQMDENLEIEIDGRFIQAPMPMVKQLRLAQIASGYLPTEDPEANPGEQIGKTNRRLEALLEDLDPLFHAENKTIIVAPWRAALRDIYEAVRKNWGSESVIAYGGQMSKQTEEQKAEAKRRFQQDDKVRFWVGNDKSTSKGHTLVQAAYLIRYASRYDFEVFVQVEDRCHRIGQVNPVLYTDFEAQYDENYTTDRDVLDSMKKKREIADIINGDDPKLNEAWLAEKMREIDAQFYRKYGVKS